MGISSRLLNLSNGLLRKRGREIVRSDRVYEWQRIDQQGPAFNETTLPAGAESALLPNNPKLIELRDRYARFDKAATTPLVWQEGYVRPEDIKYFRGDNAYVWQVRNANYNVLGYALAYYYVKSIDRHGLLDRMVEDELFGNFTFAIDGRKISRDLLDSVVELYFLDRHLGIFSQSNFTMLDIGAGYGRLAHRASSVLQGLSKYLCTDAVPISTFLSEYYLEFRGTSPKTEVVPLDEIEEKLRTVKPNIATNIHSFSECQIEAVEWWVKLLSKTGVRHFMIAPNATNCGGQYLRTNELKDMETALNRHGYRLVLKQPKYSDPVVQEYAISPTWHFLFELA